MIVLPKGSILKLGTNSLTEHNRSELQISYEDVGARERMADGGLRRQWVATKRKVSTSWDMCPTDSTKTVDGKWGGREMKQFFDANKGEFSVTVSHGDASPETFQAMFEEFSYSVQKRWGSDFWSVTLSLEEV